MTETQGKSKYDVFYFLTAIMETKEDLDFTDNEIRSNYSPFMIEKWLSMVESYIPRVEEIACCNFPPNIHYEMCKIAIPCRKVFISFIKGNNPLKAEEKRFLCNYFKCGSRDLTHIMKFLTEDEIEYIVKLYIYGSGKKLET